MKLIQQFLTRRALLIVYLAACLSLECSCVLVDLFTFLTVRPQRQPTCSQLLSKNKTSAIALVPLLPTNKATGSPTSFLTSHTIKKKPNIACPLQLNCAHTSNAHTLAAAQPNLPVQSLQQPFFCLSFNHVH